MKADINRLIKNYNFCIKCAGKLKHKKEGLLICLSCDFHFYLNPKTTNAGILLNEKGEVLLVKRKYPPRKNYWDLPGGFIELNETGEESFIREIKEELGIIIKNSKYFASYYDVYLYQNIYFPTLCLVYTEKIDSQGIKASDDISQVKFFPFAKIPFSKIAFDGLKTALRDFKTNKKLGLFL